MLYEKPICTVDAVLLRCHQGRVEFGLFQRPLDARVYAGMWAIPGGFVHTNEDNTLNDTLLRMLHTKIGLRPVYVKKMDFEGNIGRDPEGWSVTCPYLCFFDVKETQNASVPLKWLPLYGIWERKTEVVFPFDHEFLLKNASRSLYFQSQYSTLPNAFLPDRFTLGEAQSVYEAVLGKPLHKKSFRDRIAESECVVATGDMVIVGRAKTQIFTHADPHNRLYFFDHLIQGGLNKVIT